uniref:G-protein coupled receptors family 1 profile domain-containing protein n=1 Tax=Anopheles culicifacies TaxID=139723 RepID=A0A182MRR8_9DIPT
MANCPDPSVAGTYKQKAWLAKSRKKLSISVLFVVSRCVVNHVPPDRPGQKGFRASPIIRHTYAKYVRILPNRGLVRGSGHVGNALVCIAVYTNHTMRTVTNIFIVNLAVADFFVILFCLPPTVVWDVTETWFMGKAMCKVVIYFQQVKELPQNKGQLNRCQIFHGILRRH